MSFFTLTRLILHVPLFVIFCLCTYVSLEVTYISIQLCSEYIQSPLLNRRWHAKDRHWKDQCCVHTLIAQNKEGILPVATLNMTQLTVLRQRCTFSKAEVYIGVYKGDENFVTSGATLLSDLDLQETYRAIESVATGRIPSLICANSHQLATRQQNVQILKTWL